MKTGVVPMPFTNAGRGVLQAELQLLRWLSSARRQEGG